MRQSQGAASPGGAASSHPVRPPKALEVAGQACSWAPPYLPEHEADRVHHCGLDDLSPREDAPRDGVGLQLGGVGDVVTLRGGGAVGRGRLGVQTAPALSPGVCSAPPPTVTAPPLPRLCSSVMGHKPETQTSSWASPSSYTPSGALTSSRV